MPSWKKVIVSGSDATLNSVAASSQITVGTGITPSTENTLILGAPPAAGSGEGGQLVLQSGPGYTSGSHIDNWQNQFRILRGTNAATDAVIANFNLHTKQIQFPAYNSTTAFTGTVAGLLAFDSSGNIITTSGGGGGSGTVNGGTAGYVAYYPSSGTTVDDSGIYWDSVNSRMAVGNTSPAYKVDVSGDIRATGAVYANANGAMYFQGGDDVALHDINISNHLGVYGQQDSTVGSIKLGSGGGIISGKSTNIGIGTINPTYKLDVSASSNSDGIRIQNAGASRFIFNGDGVALWGGSSANAGQLTWDTGKAIVMGQSGTALSLGSNGTWDRMYINTSGDVGIGTTSPGSKLHISTTSSNPFRMVRTGGAATNFGFEFGGGEIGLYDYTTSAYNWYVASTGNIGIGTTSPSTKLHLSGTTTILTITDTTYSRTSQIGYVDSANLYLANDSNSNTYIGAYNNVFLGYGGGNVGIGTTSPGYKLDVDAGSTTDVARFYNSSTTATSVYIGDSGNSNYSVLVLDSNAGAGQIWKGGASYSNWGGAKSLNIYNGEGPIAFHSNNTANSMFIDNSGNVGIGKTSLNTKLDVNGNTLITGSLRVTAGITGSLNGNADTATTATNVTWTDSAAGSYAIATSDGTTAYYDAAGDARWDGNTKVLSVAYSGEQLNLNGKYIEQTGTGLLNYYADRHVFGDNTYNYQGQLIGGSFDAAQDITCGGTKYFDIPHQTKPGWGLKHGAIEGPESAVYFRGKLNGSNVIEFPAYWEWLVHSDSITVSLTPIGSFQPLYVAKIENNQAVIASNDQPINCHFVVYGERTDVERWDVEYPGFSRGQFAETE